jgi:hypothetical protein
MEISFFLLARPIKLAGCAGGDNGWKWYFKLTHHLYFVAVAMQRLLSGYSLPGCF